MVLRVNLQILSLVGDLLHGYFVTYQLAAQDMYLKEKKPFAASTDSCKAVLTLQMQYPSRGEGAHFVLMHSLLICLSVFIGCTTGICGIVFNLFVN